MIPKQWYVVLESREVKKNPVSVIRLGERLVFWRDAAGRVVCFRDTCIHRGARLSQGKLINGHLQCPFHGLEFDVRGKCVLIPANGKKAPVPEHFHVVTYPTFERQGFIWIWWGAQPPRELAPPSFFENIDNSYTYAGLHDYWQIHYSRVIENQLDVMHLPFVHHNTIGRGGRTLVNGPGLKLINPDRFQLFVYNRPDDGTQPRTPEQVPLPDSASTFHLDFIFPNLWQNYFSAKVFLVVAFVPVDEQNTIVYLRFYQKFLRIPLLRKLITGLLAPFNRIILHQDRRIVQNQHPQASSYHSKEHLVQADHPIVYYRKRRQQLIDQANKID